MRKRDAEEKARDIAERVFWGVVSTLAPFLRLLRVSSLKHLALLDESADELNPFY
jgi:hypothetical protein